MLAARETTGAALPGVALGAAPRGFLVASAAKLRLAGHPVDTSQTSSRVAFVGYAKPGMAKRPGVRPHFRVITGSALLPPFTGGVQWQGNADLAEEESGKVTHTTVTYAIDQPVEVTHLAAALVDEEGIFEVTSPHGNVFEVTCLRGCWMSFRKICAGRRVRRANSINWRIRRLHRAAEKTF